MNETRPTSTMSGYVAYSTPALREQILRLGFAPTEPRELLAVDAATGAARPLGQRSCHAVLGRGYIELTAVDMPAPTHHLATWLARGAGLHILALGSDAIDAEQARCAAAGLGVTPAARASRRIEYGERHGEARFEWFMFAPHETPEGLLCYAHNLTPELVFQSSVQRHPNGALALTEVVVRCAAPEAAGARWQRLLGIAPRERAAGLRFELAGGDAITLCDPGQLRKRFGSQAVEPGGADCLVASVVRVADLGQCEQWLRRSGLEPARCGAQLIVSLPAAGGALMVFH
ncbi:MAG: VOC family protein [Steroidobacteraceae bacterium]